MINIDEYEINGLGFKEEQILIKRALIVDE